MTSPPIESAAPSARPRCTPHTVSGSASAVVANGQAPSSMSTLSPRRVAVGSNPCRAMALTNETTGSAASLVAGIIWRPGATTNVDWRIAGTNDLRQQQRQPLIRAGDPPPALSRRVHRVDEPRSSASDPRRRALRYKVRFDELREMLTDRIVMQPEMLGQFRHVDGSAGTSHVAEQLVAGRVTERPGLCLQLRHLSLTNPWYPGRYFRYGLEEYCSGISSGVFRLTEASSCSATVGAGEDRQLKGNDIEH